MKTSEILKRIDELFSEKLEAKTGWGKNEVKTLYSTSVNEALMEIADKVCDHE
ncbi:hypothetical protein [Dysgonomonas sp. ZJ709]|uniref:hypothetical protein n=1 Tax=Dysgonomonas sp. ZJ709 TaxID=2709797 RepID=UPI0013EC70E3|nr:hypothetical protein [Dysgonomonas sp. ZJ709]